MRLLGGLVVEGIDGPRGRQPQGPDAPRRAGGGPGRADRRGRARRGAVGRRPAVQAERAGRGAGQPAAGVARRRSDPAPRRRLRPRRRLARPPGARRRDRGRRAVGGGRRRARRPGSPPRWPSTWCAGRCVPEEQARWFDGPRQATERSIAATRLLAAEAALVSGDPVGRRRRWRRGGSTTIRYDEAALRSLMRAHVALGRPASALAAYAEVRARLADDLGVSPSAETEALHAEILGDGARTGAGGRRPPRGPGAMGSAGAARPRRAGRRRLRRRPARRRARRCVGAPAPARWRWPAGSRTTTATSRARCASPRLAARTAWDDERRTSALTLSGRARHSRGDLAGAERDLEAAVQSTVAGVRGTGEVWLGNLRMHQGRFDEAIDLSARGAVDAAALRHPFVIPHAMWARIYALGVARPGHRDPRRAGVTRHDPRRARARPVTASVPCVDNFWGWILGGHRPDRRGRTSGTGAPSTPPAASPSRGTTRCSTWRSPRSRRRTPPPPRAWLAQVEVPPDDAGAMAWHQRHRQRLLEARVALHRGRSRDGRAPLAAWVRDDAARRGARAGVDPGRGRAAPGVGAATGSVDDAAVDATVAALDDVARLEAWRLTARLAAATGRADLWTTADALRRAARRHLRPRRRPRPSLDPERAHPPAAGHVCADSIACVELTDVVRRGEDDHAADEGLGVGAEEVEGARLDAAGERPPGSVATNGATWAMPRRQATRSAGVEVGERDGDRLRRWRRGRLAAATARAPVGGGEHGDRRRPASRRSTGRRSSRAR